MRWKDAGRGRASGQGHVGKLSGGSLRVVWGASVALALLGLAGCSTYAMPTDLQPLTTPGGLANALGTATVTGTKTPTKAPTSKSATPTATGTATPTATATTTPQAGDRPTTTAGAEMPGTEMPGTAGAGAATPTATSAPTVTTPMPATPATAPTAPTASIPTTGKTANGCAITPAQAQAEAYLANLVNQHRATAGSPPLILDQTLSLASRVHSCDMEQHQQLSHTGSDGSSPGDRITTVGLRFSTWGENIGDSRGMDALAGIAAIDKDMMAEPLTRGDHHWNIVNPAYTRLGIGVILVGSQVWFTEDFGG